MDKLFFKAFLLTSTVLLFCIRPSIILADSTIGEIKFTKCKIDVTSSRRSYKSECANFSVPEDYANPDGKKIELRIARFKAKNEKERGDAMTLLAGGPGQGAIETFVPYISALNKINANQDIYLIDQRGTGQSNQMQCPQNLEIQNEEFDEALFLELTQKCLDQLPGDPRFYTTSVAMIDLDKVRAALGLEQWNIYGGSYGTRTALHYLRQYPEHTRSVIIDAVAPTTMPLGPDIPFQSQRALDDLLSRCANEESCNTAFPDLTDEVNTLINSLKQQAKAVTIENIASGKLEEIQFTHNHLVAAVRMGLYSPMTVAILPAMLHEAAANEHYAPLARQSINTIRNMSDAMSIGMHNSVMCTEDVPFFASENIDKIKLDATYMGSDIVEMLATMCELWPTGPIDEGFRTPLVSDKPVLLISGTADPITPPEYAELVAQSLSNSKHIVLNGLGHTQLGSGCMPTVMAKFIEAASVNELRTECLDKLKPDPFFIDFNGPKP